MTVEVIIDRTTCIGSGNCIFSAPDVFEADDDGIAIVEHPEAADESAMRLAEMNCPSRSITVRTL